MATSYQADHCFVIKADDLIALNYLDPKSPRPRHVEWIDRGTDRKLSSTRLGSLLRTFHHPDPSPSVVQLRREAGIRAVFASADERGTFARSLSAACQREAEERERLETAVYPSLPQAESAIAFLAASGVPDTNVSLLWRANEFIDGPGAMLPGYSRRRVLAQVSAGGAAGAALGVAVLLIPGVGPVAAAGAVLAATFSSVATASGIIGATGAAMATMLTDADNDNFALNHREDQLKKGRIFLAVDTQGLMLAREMVRRLFLESGGVPIGQRG